MTTSRSILLVEDNEDDVFIMKRALTAAGVKNPLHVVEHGQEAVDYLAGAGKFQDRALFPLPAIIFLDLKLPLKSGHEVLAWIREQPEFYPIVIIILTSSEEPKDLSQAYKLGANSYLVKPPTVDKLIEMAKAFKWCWLEYNHFGAN